MNSPMSQDANKRELLDKIKEDYQSNESDRIKKANEFIIKNIFGNENNFALIDIQQCKLLDFLTDFFNDRSDITSLELGWILANILGLRETNLASFSE